MPIPGQLHRREASLASGGLLTVTQNTKLDYTKTEEFSLRSTLRLAFWLYFFSLMQWEGVHAPRYPGEGQIFTVGPSNILSFISPPNSVDDCARDYEFSLHTFFSLSR